MTDVKKTACILFAFLFVGTAASFANEGSRNAVSEKADDASGKIVASQNYCPRWGACGYCPNWDDSFPHRMFRHHHQRMMRIMDDFFGRDYPGNPAYWIPAVGNVPQQDKYLPDCDIKETKDAYVLSVEVPGIPKESLNISVNEGMLTISGEKKETKEENIENYHASERVYGSFQRSFTLPDNTDTDKIKAECRDGLLTVSIPKSEEKKPEVKTIKID